jgi:drug/metabolite transporter (DMT)-like permease
MTLQTLVVLFLAIGFATAGQLLLKEGMNQIGELGVSDIPALIQGVVTTWQSMLGLALFGLSSVFWLITLSQLELSTAYPFVSLSYLIILAFSVWVLNERPPLITWGGAGLIMIGIMMIGLGGFDQA